ncbi:MAG: AAA family ATPase [Azoarcus sp.]|nr:AAA family ATPase [Azoarcus sp.]
MKFAMLTGVSKFSKVNIFSGPNNLKDITLHAAYSDICGYTDADVDTVFASELEGLDRNEIRHWYNGYNWRGEAVYNPFDLLLFPIRKREPVSARRCCCVYVQSRKTPFACSIRCAEMISTACGN